MSAHRAVIQELALVHYPDGTEDEVEVPVTVKKQSDTFNPTAKEPNQTVRHNEVPDPEKSINTNELTSRKQTIAGPNNQTQVNQEVRQAKY